MWRNSMHPVVRRCTLQSKLSQQAVRSLASTSSGGRADGGSFDTAGWAYLIGGAAAGAVVGAVGSWALSGEGIRKPNVAFADTTKAIATSAAIDNVKLLEKITGGGAEGGATDPLAPPERPDLPVYRMDDVKKHATGDRIWTTYKNGVYDITLFAQQHPGGPDKIMLAAGGSTDLFWQMYMQHMTEEVMEILEELRIGTLHPEDAANKLKRTAEADDVYRNEPVRHPALIETSAKPYNAETPPSLLTDHLFTPNPLFFVRNHLPVPQTDDSTHTLTVEPSAGGKPISLSVADLKNKYDVVQVNSAIQCAGNRRRAMQQMKPGIKGLSWSHTAISNAQWTGVRLADLLRDAGIKPDDPRVKHIHFEGADKDTTGVCYGASIPAYKAFSPETIVAFEMNGEPIPVDHGYPLRVIVPGVVGARQVKWVTRIIASDVESGSHWQQRDYRAFSPASDWNNLDYSAAPSIQDGPVQSAITSPAPGFTVGKGQKQVEMKGYAWSGAGKGIIRVDVSIDDGKTWHAAEVQHDDSQDLDHMWSWSLWSAVVTLPDDLPAGPVTLIAKATDRAYNTQPEAADAIWNIRGLLNNSWHRVDINLER